MMIKSHFQPVFPPTSGLLQYKRKKRMVQVKEGEVVPLKVEDDDIDFPKSLGVMAGELVALAGGQERKAHVLKKMKSSEGVPLTGLLSELVQWLVSGGVVKKRVQGAGFSWLVRCVGSVNPFSKWV